MRKLLVPVTLFALSLGALAAPVRADEQPRRQPDKKKEARPDKKNQAGDKSAKPEKVAAYLGVYAVPVDDLSGRLKRRLKIEGNEGLVVVEVVPDSPADEAGLHHGDVITRANGKAVTDPDELRQQVNQVGPGHKIKLSVLRDGKPKEITAQPEEEPLEVITTLPPQNPPQYPSEGGADNRANRTAYRLPPDLMQKLRQLDRLQRKVSRLEKRLHDLEEKSGSKDKK